MNEKTEAVNQRNVDALVELLHAMAGAGTVERSARTRADARYLASQGVLVPSALTEEEVEELYGLRAMLRLELERIAKGEPIPQERP